LQLESAAQSAQVAVATRLVVSDFDVLHCAAIAGLGIALLPAFRCVEDLRAGRLLHVLRDWSTAPTPVHVVYPTSRYLSANVKTFVEFLQKRMTPPPWER